MDDAIANEKIQIERKQFYFDLKKNQRGVLLRITEDVRGHRDTIIVPATGLRDFVDVIHDMIDVLEDEGLIEEEPEPEDDDWDDEPPQED